jgi:TPR repeat protein
MLYNGSGSFPKDVPAGVSAYDKACDAGYEPACTTLALEYKSGGHGVAEDKDKSLAYFAKACAAGNKAACAVAPRR